MISNCSFSAVKRSFSMIFGANFRIFCELFYRTFKTVIDSDYDYRNHGWTANDRHQFIQLYQPNMYELYFWYKPSQADCNLKSWCGPLCGAGLKEGTVHVQCHRLTAKLTLKTTWSRRTSGPRITSERQHTSWVPIEAMERELCLLQLHHGGLTILHCLGCVY